MSEIRATTISDAAGTGPIDLYKQSAAKAFMLFNGTSNNIDASLNTSSVTDLATGNYMQSFSSSYSATKAYAVSLCTNDLSWGAKQSEQGGNGGVVRTAAQLRTAFFSGSGSTFNPSDAELVSVISHGDLA